MLFAIRLVDDPTKLDVRRRFLAAHLDWLRAKQSQVLVAGSLRDELSSDPIGGLWIVEASSKREVEELVRDDPFSIHGLREQVEILHWSKAFPDEQVLV